VTCVGFHEAACFETAEETCCSFKEASSSIIKDWHLVGERLFQGPDLVLFG